MRMSATWLFSLLLSACLLVACSPDERSQTPNDPKTTSSRSGLTDSTSSGTYLSQASMNQANGDGSWAEAPGLDETQKQLLAVLQKMSEVPLSVEVSDDQGIVRSIGLRVNPNIPTGVSIPDGILDFLRPFGRLWRIPNVETVVITPRPVPEIIPGPTPDSECTVVNFGATDSSGRAIVGTSMYVMYRGNMIVGISGTFSVPSPRPPGPEQISKADATEILNRFFMEDGFEALPPGADPIEVVFDPEVFGDHGYPVQAWSYRAYDEDGRLSAEYVVDARTRTVVIRSSLISRPWNMEGCVLATGETGTGVPRMVLNPVTLTPSHVSFSHMSGLDTEGASVIDRAYSVMMKPGIMEAFGTRNPKRHLQNPTVRSTSDGMEHVHFDEYYGGIPVSGAGLTIGIRLNGRAEYVAGTFVVDPGIDVLPAIEKDKAIDYAISVAIAARCQSNDPTEVADCESSAFFKLAQEPASARLSVFSTQVYRDADLDDDAYLAWEIDVLSHKVFVDAEDVRLLYFETSDLMAGADGWYPTRIFDSDGSLYWEDDQQVLRNGDPQNMMIAAWVQRTKETIDDFQFNHIKSRGPWNDYSPYHGSHLLDFEFTPYKWYTQPFASFDKAGSFSPSGSRGKILIGGGDHCEDLVAHEYTHAFNHFAGGYSRSGWEPGAINESIADVVSKAMFVNDDGSWVFSKGCSPCVPGVWCEDGIRDLKHPADYDMPSHTAFMTRNCAYVSFLGIPGLPLVSDSSNCAHFWSAVPSRAAVYMAEGVSGINIGGMGIEAVATLLLETVRTGSLQNATNFLDLSENAYQRCKSLSRAQNGWKTWTKEDCELVDLAYRDVGIQSDAFYGYYTTKNHVLGDSADIVFYQYDSLFQGCSVSDQQLVMKTKNREKRSGWADGNSVSFAGESGARVTYRLSSSDPTQREVGVHRWSEWFTHNVIYILEQISPPAGLDVSHCAAPEGYHRVMLYSTQYVNEWSNFLIGHKGDKKVNWNRSFPEGCVKHLVHGIHYHDTVPQSIGPRPGCNKGHGYTASARNSDPQSMGANLHWWHDGTRQIHARIVYHLFEDDDLRGACMAAPGVQQNP